MNPSSLLGLMWLASPALPVGGFSYSEGLEAAVDAGLVSDEASATEWLVDQLWLTLARSDMPVLHAAVAAWQRADFAEIAALNEWVSCTRESAELRLQTEQMGRSLVQWLRNQPRNAQPVSAQPGAPAPADDALAVLDGLKPAPTWPVAFSLAVARTGAAPRDALLAFAFGWAENMSQCAIKCVPLGQQAGQRVLQVLSSDIPAAVEQAMLVQPMDRQAFAPGLAVLSSQHETQYSRLFRS